VPHITCSGRAPGGRPGITETCGPALRRTYDVPVRDRKGPARPTGGGARPRHDHLTVGSADTPRRRYRPVLAATLLLLVVAVAAVSGYAIYLSHIVTSNVQKQDLLPALTPEQVQGGPGGPAPTPGVTAVTGKGLNYLFVGSDAGPGREGGRSDVIMLAHIPEDRHNVTLIHFPRDLYVDIPGHGKNKINASYAYGGAPLLVQTLQNLTGAHVDHVAVIGFEGFKAMTDAVGGVDVYVAESSSQDTVRFVAGTTMHMDGTTALEFVRSRYQLSEGDISRGQRQQEFFKALMLKVLSGDTLTNPVKLASLVDAATNNLTVDQSVDIGQTQQLALSLRSVRKDQVRFITAPFSGFANNAAGDVDVVDVAKMTAMGQGVAQDTLDQWQP